MQRRTFLKTSLVGALGLWGCGNDSNDFSGGGFSSGPNNLPTLDRLQAETIFTSTSSRVEANINAQGDVVLSVVPNGSGGALNRLLRTRFGQSTQETLVEASSAQQRFTNPRIGVSGEAFSWLETENGQTRIVALSRGQRLGPWLPSAGSQFVSNLGIDEDRGFLYAIEENSGQGRLMRHNLATGEASALELPSAGALQLRMDNACRYAIGNSSAGAVAFFLNAGRVQLLDASPAQSFSVNPAGCAGLLTAGGDLLYSSPPQLTEAQAFALASVYDSFNHSNGALFENAVNMQQQQNGLAQAAADQGILQILSLDTSAAGGASDQVYGLVVVPSLGFKGGGTPRGYSIATESNQVVSELHAQGDIACLTLNPRDGTQAPAQVLRFTPSFS
jgi:hypothetical protein